MSRRRIVRRFQDAYAMRRGIFFFFLFSFCMVAFFKVLKIVHETEHREEFHNFITNKVDYLLSHF